ncbi:hypothetical protein BH11ARM2_BH11ARM2_08070 [soil metagenome]
MKKTLAFALVLAAIPAAQASLTTTALSTDPNTTSGYASTPGNSLSQPLHGFTLDNRTTGQDSIGSLTWAVDANHATGYTDFSLHLKGFYYAPASYDEFGDPNTVIQIGGAVKTFDNTAPLTPLTNTVIPYREFDFASVLTPFDMTVNVHNPYAVKNGHVETEIYFFAAKGTLLTFDEVDLTAQPVPEPASLAALGLGGLALLRRRKKA